MSTIVKLTAGDKFCFSSWFCTLHRLLIVLWAIAWIWPPYSVFLVPDSPSGIDFWPHSNSVFYFWGVLIFLKFLYSCLRLLCLPSFGLLPHIYVPLEASVTCTYLEMQEIIQSITCNAESDTDEKQSEWLGLICELRLYMIKRKNCISWHKGPIFITFIFSMSSFIAGCNVSILPHLKKKESNIIYQ